MSPLGGTRRQNEFTDGQGETDVHLLHVDDDPGLLDLAATFVEREREAFEVTTATDARTGLEILDEEQIDCIVSDYDMPEMNGLEFLEAVREQHPELPFLLFTGKGSEEIASEAISAGVTEYLQKDTGTEQYSVLANRIEQSVSRRRAESELAETKRRQEVLLKNLPGMVYRCSTEEGWPMEFVSEGALDLVGYDPDELMDGQVNWEADIIHPTDRERTRAAAVEAVENGESFEITYRIRTADGRNRWVWEQGQGIASEDHPMLEGFITDVTDRKRHEQALQAERETFDAVADGIQAFVLVIDLDADAVVETNAAAADIAVDWTETPASALFESGLTPFRDAGEQTLSLAESDRELSGTVTRIDVEEYPDRSVFVGGSVGAD